MTKLYSTGFLLSLWVCVSTAEQSILITGQQAQVLFEIADRLYSTFPDDFYRDNPNETIYEYNCKFQDRKGKLHLVLCEGPGGSINGDRAEKLASIGLGQKFKLTQDPGFENGSSKGVGLYFKAKCIKLADRNKISYSCELVDLKK